MPIAPGYSRIVTKVVKQFQKKTCQIGQIIFLPFLKRTYFLNFGDFWLVNSAEWAACSQSEVSTKFKKVRQKDKNMIWRVFWKYLTFSTIDFSTYLFLRKKKSIL